MSEFLLVVPEGWTEINYEDTQIAVCAAVIDAYIAESNYGQFAADLIAGGLIAEGATILEAMVFNGEKLLVKLG